MLRLDIPIAPQFLVASNTEVAQWIHRVVVDDLGDIAESLVGHKLGIDKALRADQAESHAAAQRTVRAASSRMQADS
jgi:hypothetical protein